MRYEPRLNTIKWYLDGGYASVNPDYQVQDSKWKTKKIVELISARGLAPNTVCEVGCGAGEVLRGVQRSVPSVQAAQGFDISPHAIKKAKVNETGELRYFQREFGAEPRSDEVACYDLMLCIDIIEHVEDCLGFLRTVRTRASDFIFHIPLDMNVQMVLRAEPIMRVRKNVGHLHYFSFETAIATLLDSGFRVEYWTYTPSGVERAKTARAQLAKLPRIVFFLLSKKWATRLLGGYSLLVHARS